MSQELFQAVKTAEESAEQVIQEAQHEARELLKAMEAKIKADERSAALEHRTKYQQIMEEKRVSVEKQIEEQKPQMVSQQQESLNDARAKLEQAAQMIFERVWNDGDS